MSNYAISLKRTGLLLAAMSFTALLLVVNFAAFFGNASAADLTARSLTLSSTLDGDEAVGAAGSATNGAAATHTVGFTAVSAATQISLDYCTTAIGTCVAPTGIDLSAATVSAQSGSISAFTTATEDDGLDGGTDNALVITGGTVAGGAGTISVANIKNPTSVGTFFVRIRTETTGPLATVDEGVVASAITEGIQITARVAETLGFSTTGSFAGVGDPGTTCAALTGSGAITLGDPDQEGTLELTQAYDNYSAFRLYTNAAGGVVVQYNGDTLTRTAGGDIDAIGAAAAESDPGTEQFGLAVNDEAGNAATITAESVNGTLDTTYVNSDAELADANTGPLTFAPAYASGAGALGVGGAQFAFVANTPTTIASTSTGGNGFTECKTAAVRYVANISPTTTSGTYTTTIVYSAVPTY